ncbi:Ig-like domain-containing protein [Aureliella helgolandensis]|uniref:LTD domain-containing protein n=1 Tax=Aureliella helgolandensis TaxID=2527968 RepID=A0A518G8R6_9BACT|nr:Ig-like domain-containing protein [Aureliella helgolandensis]QDV24972.1 hypothetical protein Q31a_32940 [Aureliella helgolandensis]
MSFRRFDAFLPLSLSSQLRSPLRKRKLSRNRRRNLVRKQLVEQLEARELMALDILSVSPANEAMFVAVESNLVFNFSDAVVKGQGNIHVVDQSTGVLGIALDVNSPAVSIAGAEVTVDLPENLLKDAVYEIYIDSGAFIDTSTTETQDATLLVQDFDFLPLGPFEFENGGDGTDFTLDPPLGFSVDNSNMPGGGVPEWSGWSFADRDAWAQVDDQNRSSFTLANNTIAIADTDEWADTTPRDDGSFNSLLQSKTIQLDGVAASSVVVEFDSSFRPENSQVGVLEVRYDGGDWTNLLTLDPSNTSNAGNASNLNEHRSIEVDNPTSGEMEFRWGVVGANDWWWGIDNLHVTGDITGVPFAGVDSPAVWSFATEESPKLKLSIDPAEMNENGGSALGTVSRNGPPTEDMVVTLVSNDTSEATVPATVTILAGQTSATFPITAVDDALSDRIQIAAITASSVTHAAATAEINVLDDEGPKIVTLTPADDATDVDYQSNLSIAFDVDIKKGNGLVNLVRTSDNVLIASIDINSPLVTISGSTMTIDPPLNLDGLTGYYLRIDDGALLDTSTTSTPNATLLTQDFDLLNLNAFSHQTGGDGTDVTHTPPTGFAVDNSGITGGANSDWYGWSFADKESWLATNSSQGRAEFEFGSGNVAVADPGVWYNSTNDAVSFNSYLSTNPIDLSGVDAGSVAIEFDSSFVGALPQIGTLEVSYNGGGSWTEIMAFDADGRNAHIRIDSSTAVNTSQGGGTLRNKLLNPASGEMIFRFGVENAGNHRWWAIDNIKISGGVTGVPFQGIATPTDWNFTTAVAPTITLSTDKPTVSEGGGTITGTVTRNRDTVGDLVVTLTSSNTAEATVPATVTIPDGAASVDFVVTGVDDAIRDFDKLVTLSATATDYFSESTTVLVTDDDFPKPITFSPADDSLAVPVDSDLVIEFDEAVKKGNGFVHVLRASDNKVGFSIDIQSSAVTVAGSTVTINPTNDLIGDTDYYVSFDNGAILNLATSLSVGTTLLKQDFELLPLGPHVFETDGISPEGTDFTLTPPTGYSVDNSNMSPGGVPEWSGWSFARKEFWVEAAQQNRDDFTLGQGTIAIADADEFDDFSSLNRQFNSLFLSSPIDLTHVAAGTVQLEFDSSFLPEGSQTGIIDVTYDGGTTWENLKTIVTEGLINEHLTIPVTNPASGEMQFRFGLTGLNNWWWAIDNIHVTGAVSGVAFPGIANSDSTTTDATTWNFTTAAAPGLSVSVDSSAISESGGTAVGTVTRNTDTTAALVVTLSSTDAASVGIPTSVVIPAGQASTTFAIAAIDDSLADGLKQVTISASALGLLDGATSISINDNEVGDIVISEIMYNPNGGEPQTEWVELYNRGTTTIDLGGWTLDDEDGTDWGKIAEGIQLAPGQVGVLYNNFFDTISDTDFRTSWSVPTEAIVAGIFWGDLANDPTTTGEVNEVLTLIDAGGEPVEVVNYGNDGTQWPQIFDGPSIYLAQLTGDSQLGTNWMKSVVDTNDAIHPSGDIYDAADIGSPGRVSVTTDTDAPAISAVYAAADTWTTDFIDAVDGGGTGAGNGLGVAVVAGGATLPWNTVNRLYLQFSENVIQLDATSLEIRDSDGTLPFTFSYDANTHIATIDMEAAFSYSKLRLAVADSVTDASGNALDGDASGTAGGLFEMRFDVLPGDGDGDGRTTPADLNVLIGSLNRRAGQDGYNPFADWDTDSRGTPTDLSVLIQFLNRQISTLAEPAAAFPAAAALAVSAEGEQADSDELDQLDAFFATLGDAQEKNTTSKLLPLGSR